MLAYILAIAIAFISLAIYLAAFLFPDIHRKDDFFWSGIGLFYALVLWLCASRITGAILLGQIASVSLIAWFSWQTVIYRRAVAHPEEKIEILNFSILDWLQTKITAKKPQISTTETTVVTETTTTEDIETTKETEEIVANPVTTESNLAEDISEEIEETTAESTVLEENTDDLVTTSEETEQILKIEEEAKQEEKITKIKPESQSVKTAKKGFGLGNIFNKISLLFKKKTEQSSISKTTEDEDSEITVDEKIVQKENKENIDPESLLNLLDENIPEQKTEPEQLPETQETTQLESIKITTEKSVEISVTEIKPETEESIVSENLEPKNIETETIETEETSLENNQDETKLEQEILENPVNESQEKVIEVSTEAIEDEPQKIIQKSQKIISKSTKISSDENTKSEKEIKKEENPADDNPFNDLTS